ncbi:uncharacterized protein LACBIDRAFT_326547 [Laccaria bicolor S238N-H82]|uniref:Predicted protein n=1 Tax=Laccaria bicolor (strain S238N-H82 / ATCC MYA-4686) TaxID=486041 RepID=B0D8Z3_LACBS|nr:uncharacterized protein LACBIDRAFT_326547 [Laccaria bicolor S238N-H82]EDR08923.1 predicted protein [Laccaria bicolor S238N-H82]|eukprot:XP_001880236.1 predicted protein [Laccaria bicolor S238N-H82]
MTKDTMHSDVWAGQDVKEHATKLGIEYFPSISSIRMIILLEYTAAAQCTCSRKTGMFANIHELRPDTFRRWKDGYNGGRNYAQIERHIWTGQDDVPYAASTFKLDSSQVER